MLDEGSSVVEDVSVGRTGAPGPVVVELVDVSLGVTTCVVVRVAVLCDGVCVTVTVTTTVVGEPEFKTVVAVLVKVTNVPVVWLRTPDQVS